jgi:hypothetical protein
MYNSIGDKDAINNQLNELLSIVDQTKKELKMSGWIRMPKYSEEYQYYELVCGTYEAYSYVQLGGMSLYASSEENQQLAITHFKKARAIFTLVGMTDKAKQMEGQIKMSEIQVKDAANEQKESTGVTNPLLLKTTVKNMKNVYEQKLNSEGINSVNTIRIGMQYANLLSMFGRHIETEQLAAKLAPASRRVHGPDHTITIDTNELLNKCKKRCIAVHPENKLFHALRYESGGTVCVANGPIMYPRNKNNERTTNSRIILLCQVFLAL